jgi:PAS domain S-box-containing protein
MIGNGMSDMNKLIPEDNDENMAEGSITLLLIEDNPGDARLIQEMLRESTGYDLRVANNLTDGMKAARETRFDVLILDLGLPECYGLDTLTRVRDELPDMVIVVLTGHDDMDCALDSIKQGAQDYLIKGQVDSQTLIRIVRYAIERKQAEAALRKSEKQASAALEAARAFSFSYDIMEDSLSWGGAITEITGFSVEEFKTITLSRLTEMVHPEDQDQVRASLQDGIGGMERVHAEFQFQTRKGYINLAMIGITEKADGRPIRLVGLMQDITDEIKRDAELQRLNVALEEKNQEMQQLFHITSHDLRSPLANIKGFSEDLEYFLKDMKKVLATEEIPVETKEKIEFIINEDITTSLQYITNAIAKMDNLIIGLLRIARLGTTELTITDLNMVRMFRNISDTFAYELKEKGIKLDIGDVLDCRGDERQINQVFSNIIGNAIKYHDPEKSGNIVVRGKREKERVIYSIQDNGIGIAKEHQEKVFGLFQRIDKKATQGDGLGLTAVQRILSRHDGKIWLESELGIGSTFYISLPSVE